MRNTILNPLLGSKYPYENVYNKDFMSEEVIIKEGEVMEILDARGNGDNGTAKIALRTPLGYEWRTDYRFKFHIEQNGLQRQEGYSGMIGRHIVGPATVKIGYKYPENLIGMLGNSNNSNDFYKWNITDSNEESEFWGHIAYMIRKSSDEYKYLQFKYPYENVYNKDFMSEEVIIKEGEVMEILDARGNGDNGTAQIALRTPLGYEWRTDYRFKFHIEQNGLQRQEGYSGMIGRHIVSAKQ